MYKKIIRIFIALCLMLVMTSATAMAAPTNKVGVSTTISANCGLTNQNTKSFQYYLFDGTWIRGTVTGIYSSVDNVAKITSIDAYFRDYDANEYTYYTSYDVNQNAQLIVKKSGTYKGTIYFNINTSGYINMVFKISLS
ncbi:hypothetical protein C8E03_12415 [Lachnotalea glycerini]|uniref:Uncharacterized protein n=1 Tax=Lachnotalea glycerini TaxID=1763509 RepID=A0A318EG67_9FIRM|nr:hypothetical protein [Lachnotalea glycerini]PXV84612.1 hypothetical protein C8E03_12415 [Lachnotalea glycerini]